MLQADLGLATSRSFEKESGGGHFVEYLLGMVVEGTRMCGTERLNKKRKEGKDEGEALVLYMFS